MKKILIIVVAVMIFALGAIVKGSIHDGPKTVTSIGFMKDSTGNIVDMWNETYTMD